MSPKNKKKVSQKQQEKQLTVFKPRQLLDNEAGHIRTRTTEFPSQQGQPS